MKSNCLNILYVFLLGIYSPIYGQSSYNDFVNEQDLNKKSEKGLELWNYYLRNSLDSLKMSAIHLILESNEQDHSFGLAIGRRSLGSYLIRSGNIDKGLIHLTEAKNYFDKKEDYILLSETLNEIGNGKRLLGKFNEAINYYQQSLDAGEKSSDPTAKFNAEYGLGNTYLESGDTATAEVFLHRYKNESIKRLKYEAAADAFAVLGMIAMEEGNSALSREYYTKSLFFSSKSNSKSHLSHAYNNKAILHFNLEELDSALYYFRKSLDLRRQLKHTKGIIESYYNLGSYYFELDKLSRASEYFWLSADIAAKHHYNVDERDALDMLLEVFKTLNKNEEILAIQLRKDSLNAIIDNVQALNDDIIQYAESSIIKNEQAKKSTLIDKVQRNNWIWIVPLMLLLVTLILFYFKKRTNSF